MNDNFERRDQPPEEERVHVTPFHIVQMICGGLLLLAGIGGAILNVAYPEAFALLDNIWLVIGVSLVAFLLSCLPVWYYEWRRRQK